MKELIVDLIMNQLILCNSKDYNAFVRQILENQQNFHLKGGDKVKADTIAAEILRLDSLYLNHAMAS